MKKVLFINRDGILIKEYPENKQLNSLEKLEYYPKVFQILSKIAIKLDYEFVMLINQDKLGICQKKIIQAFKNEGIEFSEILINNNTPKEYELTKNGIFSKYIYGDYDLSNSYIVGNRRSDTELAKKLNCKSIFIGDDKMIQADISTSCWTDIYVYLCSKPRIANINRKTTETDIRIEINIDGSGHHNISTGIGFFDHMLEQIAKHGNIDLNIQVKGDLDIDEHHTIEDVALTLGEVFIIALNSKKGIERYGFLLPMDDCLAQVAIDFGGRPQLVWNAEFKREMIGKLPSEMFSHFFKSFSNAAKCNLNIKAEGENEHHKIEAIFKAFAKAIKIAISKTNNYSIPSTKGSL